MIINKHVSKMNTLLNLPYCPVRKIIDWDLLAETQPIFIQKGILWWLEWTQARAFSLFGNPSAGKRFGPGVVEKVELSNGWRKTAQCITLFSNQEYII